MLSLCRCGFYLSILLLLYGTLFPFQFDLAPQSLSRAWSVAGLIPFWDSARGRIHSLPDMLANALLAIPLGFFGSLWFHARGKLQNPAAWFAIGLCLGLLSEIIQLAIPQRVSDITDAINNGLGASAGAVAAALFGQQILNLLSASVPDRRAANYWLLASVIAAGMLLPFDLTLDVGHFRSGLKTLLVNPWESGTPIENEWITAAEFALLGALAASIRRRRVVFFTLTLPFYMEASQLLVDSHAPSLRDLAMNFAGAAGGAAAGFWAPALVRPAAGFILMNLAVAAQGLSPYRFAAENARERFEWIPLIEYYNRTTGAALYDALTGLLAYALLAALWPRRAVIIWALLLAGGIEAAQIFIVNRFAGTTDILIAGIGAWVGCLISKTASGSTHFIDIEAKERQA